MFKVQMLRALVKQRLTAAEFEQFERTIAEYEEEVCRLREDNERQQKLLDAVFNPQLRLHRAVFPADVQQLLLVKEEVPPEVSMSLDQEDPEPPHIKEEQEDLCIGQDGEQLHELEEDVIKFTFTPVPVKSEDDEEKPQSSQLHQRQTEQVKTETDTEDTTSDSSENEDWKETGEPLKYVTDLNCTCYECGKRFSNKTNLKVHMLIHTREKPFGCTDCPKRFSVKSKLIRHMAHHEGEKRFSCSVCMKRFGSGGEIRRHMRSHTGAFIKPGVGSMMKVYVRQKVQKIF